MTNKNFVVRKKFYSADGMTWYTIGCNNKVGAWMREKFNEQFHEHINEQWHISLNVFDIPEKLYTELILRWS